MRLDAAQLREALKERVKVSPLGAFFHTEIGPLNQIIHIWPYDDLQHRTRVRSQKIEGWPPKIQEFIVEMESKIVIAAPFSPTFTARQRCVVSEMRTYTLRIFYDNGRLKQPMTALKLDSAVIGFEHFSFASKESYGNF